MSFSEDDLAKLNDERATLSQKYAHLLTSFVFRKFHSDKAQEYAAHGFARRLKILVRCIENVFEILPPKQLSLPTSEELTDATIQIQAFIFNVFGSVDNLAWIWVQERNLKQQNGEPIPSNWIGLRQNNEFVRKSFSVSLQEYLRQLDPWFDYLESFRHALAHRIPLYIPPYMVAKDKADAYHEIEKRKSEAWRRGDLDEYESLEAQQKELVFFRPIIEHSLVEGRGGIVFHAQLIADFNTIDEIARKILKEFDSAQTNDPSFRVSL